MDHTLVRALRSRGVDVLTAFEAGMIERPDPEHLHFASRAGRVLCTCNVSDFYALHQSITAAGTSHAGLILMPQQRYSLGEQLRRLLRIISTITPENMVDRAELLSAWHPVD